MVPRSPWITLGSSLKRVTDQLYGAVDAVYAADGVVFLAAWFPTFRALVERGSGAVSEVAEHIGQSHAAVSQVSKKLAAAGYVESSPGTDRRQRQLSLTPAGRVLAARLRDLWLAIEGVLRDRLAPMRGDVTECVDALESALATDAMQAEMLARARVARAEAVRWQGLKPGREEAFARLNLEWLEANFEVEELDRTLLSDPERSVIEPGGEVIFAELHGELVGTCALLPHSEGVFELSKMAVTPLCRGLGLGRGLLREAIRRFTERGGQRLFLESSSKLPPALALYESEGFVPTERADGPSPYARSDVYMVLQRPS